MLDPLRPLWGRADERLALFSWDEVHAWPEGALDLLVDLGLPREVANTSAVTCDACGGDHAEEVTRVEAPPGTGLRAYIVCPEAWRVHVPLGRLRRWEINFLEVAAAIAAALGTASQVEEVLPGRVWLLGRLGVGGQTHEFFLCRGLGWPDGAEAIGRAPRLSASASPVVLVPGAVPPKETWDGVPTLLPLSGLLSWDGGGIAVAWDVLQPSGDGRPKKATASVRSFPTPAGATWEDVRLTVGEHRLQIDVRGRRGTFSFAEAGFEEAGQHTRPPLDPAPGVCPPGWHRPF